ncbi:hypothetical protein ABZ864_28250 [Streptomyces sp. NPDC047082]|uniref:hypothetical protein n=1 Tax=Streptomyces sp. NPDC047082 TaxID=3155259 RepID=UPI0033E02A63
MSREAQHAPIPPRPTTPPPGHPDDSASGEATTRGDLAEGRPLPGGPSGSRRVGPGAPAGSRTPGSNVPSAESVSRSGGEDDAGRTASGPPDGQPRFPTLRPFRLTPSTTSAPPPPASARFPDAPPTAGREPLRTSADQTGPGATAPPRRPGTPPATRLERPARLRPVPPARTPEPPTGRAAGAPAAPSGPASPAVPPRPATRPDSASPATTPAPDARPGSAGIPPQPDREPDSRSAESLGRTDSAAVPPKPTTRPDGHPAGVASRAADASGTSAPPRPVKCDPRHLAGPPAPSSAPPSAGGGASGNVTSPAPVFPPRSADGVPPRPVGEPVSGQAWGPARVGDAPASQAPGSSASHVSPDPALSWSAARHVVSFGDAEGYDERGRPRPLGAWVAPRTAAAAACVVLGLGLIGGAVTGSWLTGDSGSPGTGNGFTAAAAMWHNVPVDELFPPAVEGNGAGPGGADRTWTRVAVAPDSGCAHALDPLLRKALAPVGCQRLLRATYTDATQSYVTTVGLLFTKADSAAMTSLATRFKKEGLDRRTDLMPRPYAAKNTVAAAFGAKQRASWTISVLTDAPVVVYAVSGWADGRTADSPLPAADAMESGATSAPAQAGLGQEAQGLADRIQRRLRQTVSSATETPS